MAPFSRFGLRTMVAGSGRPHFPASTTTHSKFVGTYLSHPHDDAQAGPSMDLSLGADGTATVTEDPGKAAPPLSLAIGSMQAARSRSYSTL